VSTEPPSIVTKPRPPELVACRRSAHPREGHFLGHVQKKLAVSFVSFARCMLNFAIERKYISENPASRVRPFDERRERPAKRMLSLEDEQRILDNAPAYLGVAIVLLAQTGGRTYTEGFSLRWDQIDLDHNVIFFGGKTKTEGSSESVPLTGLAPMFFSVGRRNREIRAHSSFRVRSNPISRSLRSRRLGRRR
jgi:integrase